VEVPSEERRNVVASGKTVEDAIASGLAMLGVHRDQVNIEILKEGSRGVLGFGAENAQVRLLVKAPPKPRQPEPASESLVIRKPEPATTAPAPAAKPKPKVEPSTEGQVGREVLVEILTLMGIHAKVEVLQGDDLAEEGEPPPSVLNITGGDLGILIGRRGETLRALQYLLRLMVSHRLKHWTDLIVDVENYRVRRQQALKSLANRVAERVAQTGRSQALEPMPAYERRMVHIALRNHPQVKTQSVGEGERRKVTIIPRR
jgi:spoIIIJ-associated protein